MKQYRLKGFKILTFILCLSFVNDLQSQNKSVIAEKSIEASFAFGIMDFIPTPETIVAVCDGCSYFTNDGYEYSTRFSFNKLLKERQEISLGLGLNVWEYQLTNFGYGGIDDFYIDSEFLYTIDIQSGYRYFINSRNKINFFLENVAHFEITLANYLERFRLSFEPGFGIMIPITAKVNLLTSSSYKLSLTNLLIRSKPQSFNFKLGLNVGI